jgi:hypothetical protein
MRLTWESTFSTIWGFVAAIDRFDKKLISGNSFGDPSESLPPSLHRS